MTTIFTQEKQQQIDHLVKNNGFLNKLISNNHKSKLLTINKLAELETLLASNNVLLKKLTNNEFEIAIVGLEKAGKSTFANALIESIILPSAPERCTFTSTRLVNGDDKGVVTFFTENEFNNNFTELLAGLNFPDAKSQHFKMLPLATFTQFFASLEDKAPDTYKSHVGKTDKEIEDIINAKDKLTLDGSSLEFVGGELYLDEFKSYIRGDNDGNDTSKPRSAKNIEIFSSKLNQLKNAIIYDVPGFDSPTKIHEMQTIERLKSADAIILITNVGTNPSLLGTQLNIIRNNSDDDGIALKDKLFIFGNSLDRANGKAESERNIDTLTNDVEKYQIGVAKRVFTGSAKKYLIDLGIDKGEFFTNFEFDTGLEKIRQELINYYETERFEILKRKISHNNSTLNTIFNEIKSSYSDEIDTDSLSKQALYLHFKFNQQLRSKLKLALNTLKAEIKSEIYENKYFTNQMIEHVENSDYFSVINEDDFTKNKIFEDDSISQDVPYQKINQALRKKLHYRYLADFSNIPFNIRDEKTENIKLRILNTFVQAIANGKPTFDGFIESESNKIIQSLTENIADISYNLSFLIERFSRDVVDILISFPRFSADRKAKYEIAIQQYLTLDSYYSNDGSLINMLLTGKNEPIIDINLAKLMAFADTIFTASNSTGRRLKKFLDEILNNDNQYRYDIESVLENCTSVYSKSGVIDEINDDIKNLKTILINAIIPSLGLELVYVNAIDKQIRVVLDCIDNDDENSVFTKFISDISSKANADELADISTQLERYNLQKAYVKELEQFI